MAELTASQAKRRAAVERLLKLTEPGLNLILAAGDRLSRLVEPEDHEYYPARPFIERDPDGASASPERVAPPSKAKPARRSTSATRAGTTAAARSKTPPRSRAPRRRGPGEPPQR